MKNTYIAGVAAVLVLAVAIGVGSSITNGKVARESTGPIKIGAIMILSGPGASYGEASRNGMALAIEDINNVGGVNGRLFEGIYENDEADPKKTVSAFKKLTTYHGVKFIIGPNWSNTGLAVKDLAKETRTVMISPSLGIKEFNEDNEYLFNTWPHDDILSAELARIVYANGHRRVAILGAEDTWALNQTQAFKQTFEKIGGEVIFVYEPPSGTTDVRAEVAKLNKLNPDAVVMTSAGYGLLTVYSRQLEEMGVNVPLYPITIPENEIAACGAFCEGMIFPTFLTPTADFYAKYKAKYEREVELGADSAYDAVMMLAEAMKATNSTDPEKVKVYLANFKTFDGASGHLVSDGKRAFTKDHVLKVVRNAVPVDLK